MRLRHMVLCLVNVWLLLLSGLGVLKEIVLFVQEERLRVLLCRASPTLMYTPRITWGDLVEVQIPIQSVGKGPESLQF